MNQDEAMPKVSARTYSRYSLEAIALLGALIRAARKEREMTTQLGATFEVATIVGVKLFDADATTLTRHIRHTEDKLALLPKSIRKRTKDVDDDF
jgi:hypothetical protein